MDADQAYRAQVSGPGGLPRDCQFRTEALIRVIRANPRQETFFSYRQDK